MKRTVLLILCAALLCSTMSCGETAPETADTTAAAAEDTTTVPAETELKPDLPDVNYKGADFTILNGNTTTWMTIAKVTAEEENGEAINDAIYKRNLAVEEKYGVNIVEVPSDSARAQLLEAIAAGDKTYDIALMVMADALTVTLENSVMDYADVPHIDTSKPWWVAGTADRMSLGGHVYYAISQFDTTHYDGVRSFFFNKQLIEDFELDNPYQLVYDGKWTLDAMKTMGLKVAQDLNGDAKWGEGDRYGYSSYESIGAQTLCSGAGAIVSVNKDENDMPVFDMNNEHYLVRLDKITRMLSENEGLNNPNGTNGNGGDSDAFVEGRVLFFNETLSNIKKLRDMDQDFGILPAPKYDEAQERYYNLGGNPYFMLVPITTKDVERTGVIIEAMAYESLGRIDTAFYDIYLQGKLMRDEDSPKMLDLIFSTLDYFLPIARSTVNSGTTSRVWSGDTAFASYFAEINATVQAEIDAVKTFLAGQK